MDPDNPPQGAPEPGTAGVPNASADPRTGPVAPAGTSSATLASIQTAEDNWNTANANYSTAEEAYRAAVTNPKTDQATVQAASAQYDNARNALTKAASDLAAAHRAAAQAETAAAKLEGSPETRQERTARANYYNNRANAVTSQVSVATARAASFETPQQRADREQANRQLEGEQRRQDIVVQGDQARQTEAQTSANQGANRQAEIAATGDQNRQTDAARSQQDNANRISQIMATRDANIAQAQAEAANTQDLEKLKSSLQRINAESLANLNAELSRQTEQQKFDMERPFKERTTAVAERQVGIEAGRAQTDAQRVAQEGTYQQGELAARAADTAQRTQAANQQTEFSYRSTIAKGLGDQSSQAQQLGMSAKGGGVAPGMGNAIADPQRMMYEVLQEGLKNGMWNASRIPNIPGWGAPAPQGQDVPDQGAPDPAQQALVARQQAVQAAPVPAGARY